MATIAEIDGTRITVEFDQLQRAISPGQFAVLYDNERVIGSAQIIV
jgi:tRNA U34 2-thiouridine synthase MnmA/TrmU